MILVMNLYEIDVAQIIIYHVNDCDKICNFFFFFGVRKDFDPKEKEKKEELVASCFLL